MDQPNLHWILLSIVITIQFLFLFRSFWVGYQIKEMFPSDVNPYKLQEEDCVYYINVISSSKDIVIIKNEINEYLKNHYSSSKTPDISQISIMIKERSRIHDGLANFIATVPILLGLAGTVLGLFFAFFNFQDNNDSSNFLSLISKSSSIAFIGTLSGITCTLVSNFFINYSKKQRDIRLNIFFSFLNSRLSPRLPTLKDETVAIIATSLHSFSEQYFTQFKIYTNEFKEINKEITQLYQNGLKGVIERNSVNLEQLNIYIQKLDNLFTVTRDITFKPAMVTEFSNTASVLVASLKTSSNEHNDNAKYLKGILTAYQKLEERVHTDIIDLTADKQIFGDYGTAVTVFLETSKSKLEEFSKFSETFKEEIQNLSTEYKHTVGSIKDKLVEQVERNFNSEGYKDFAMRIESIQSSIEKESDNIKQLSISLADLNSKLANSLIPAFTKTSESINSTNNFLKSDLPKAMKETIEVNKKMIMETSEKLLSEPKSWGQWTFKIAKNIFRGK